MESLFHTLKALGDGTRFRIVERLLAHPACVTSLARCLGVSESAVSQHLRVLREAGLVRGEKRGYWTHYSVDRDAMRPLARELDSLASSEEKRGCQHDSCCGVD